MTTETPRLGYSINEASEATSMSKRTIWRLIADGKLKTVQVGRRVIITAKSLHTLMGEEMDTDDRRGGHV